MTRRQSLRQMVFVALTHALACGGRDVQLLGDEHVVQMQTKWTVVAGALTLYRFDGLVDSRRPGPYPSLGTAFKGWNVRPWFEPRDSLERASLMAFLDSESEKYAATGRDSLALAHLRRVREALSREKLDSGLVSYAYKANRPGAPGYMPGEWLYVYFLDLKSRSIVEISNAFR